jgi:putative copper export protein
LSYTNKIIIGTILQTTFKFVHLLGGGSWTVCLPFLSVLFHDGAKRQDYTELQLWMDGWMKEWNE